jgi:hypothetical protein
VSFAEARRLSTLTIWPGARACTETRFDFISGYSRKRDLCDIAARFGAWQGVLVTSMP